VELAYSVVMQHALLRKCMKKKEIEIVWSWKLEVVVLSGEQLQVSGLRFDSQRDTFFFSIH